MPDAAASNRITCAKEVHYRHAERVMQDHHRQMDEVPRRES